MKTSEAFKIARRHLWSGTGVQILGSRYCCLMLDKHVEDEDVADRCKKIISSLLDGHETLEDWLIDADHLPWDYYLSPDKDIYVQKIQTTRKAWLNHLIEHYKALGD